MQPRELTRLRVKEWPGLISNSDPNDLPPGGAVEQENIRAGNGSLKVRRGVQRSTEFTPSSPAAYDLISLYNFQRPEGDRLITFDTNGSVKAKRGSAAYSIVSGKNTYGPYSFAKTRKNYLIGVNGVERGFIWRGMDSAAIELGVDAPASSPSVAIASGGGATAGDYVCAVRFVDDDVPTGNPSNLCDLVTVTATDGQKFNWTSIPQPSQSRVSAIELWRSTSDYPNVLYFVASLSVGTTSYGTDTSTDNTLISNAAADDTKKLVVLNPDGSENANRYTPPPRNKRVAMFFQDRMFYLVDPKYTTGTVSLSSGSPTVTGTNTAWTTDMAGRYLYVPGQSKGYRISTRNSATSLTLAENAGASVSGSAYAIMPEPTQRDKIYFSEPDLPEAVPATNTITLQQNTGDDDELTGAMALGSMAYLMKERHIYSMSFVRQPIVDVDVRPIAHRGCLNFRCFDLFEGVAYIMDQMGIYRLGAGGGIEPISLPIQNYWTDDIIDFSKADWFHVTADFCEELIRFHVALDDDTGTRPMRALVWDIRNSAWWLETYIDALGGSCRVVVNGRQQVAVAGEDDTVFLMNQGTTDVLAAQIRGTVTSSGTTTLTDSTANFAASAIGAPVAIVSGTGKAQIRKITARTSTQLTVDSAWTTNPAAGDVYVIGAIPWSWKSGMMPFALSPDDSTRSVEVTFKPTTGDASIDMRRYFNWETTPENAPTNIQFTPSLVQRASGSPNDVIDLKKTRSARGHATGVWKSTFSGHGEDRMEGRRFLTLEFRGYQGNDEIVLADMVLAGFEFEGK